MGIIETGSGRFDEIAAELASMPSRTTRPWGVNIPQMLVRDPAIVDFVVEHGVRFVTTSAGNPKDLAPRLKDAGITVFHVVPTLAGALKAVDAGVDGLIVEGIEGGGFKTPDSASTMVLVPLIASRVDVPIIAAGGICDGVSMAAAFALGAEGVQMGTRMVASAESPVHDNWKRSIVEASELDTVILNRYHKPSMRVLRTAKSAEAERLDPAPRFTIDELLSLYFGGQMDASYANCGQVAGRIDAIEPVADILRRTWDDCRAHLAALGRRASS
jgi:enoyl-[acyl-carrier protein] reductase II